jgi:SPP1 gp7 family putative phage head morphogenesis protein
MSIITRQLKIIAEADAELAKLEAAQIDRTNAALEKSLLNLLKDLRGKFSERAGVNLIGRDRALLLANDLRDALNVFSPNNPQTQALLRDFEQITIDTDRVGRTLAEALINTYEPTIASTVDLSLDVVGAIARQGYDRLLSRGAEFANNASTAIGQGILQGWGIAKITTAVKAIGGITRSEAERIVRTESNRAAISAVKERYRADEISKVIWIATQDKRTCPRCAARAGGVYEMDRVTVPLHPNDRCYISPYKQSWADAGLIDFEWMQEHHNQAVVLAGKADISPSPWEIGGKPKRIVYDPKAESKPKAEPKEAVVKETVRETPKQPISIVDGEKIGEVIKEWSSHVETSKNLAKQIKLVRSIEFYKKKPQEEKITNFIKRLEEELQRQKSETDLRPKKSEDVYNDSVEVCNRLIRGAATGGIMRDGKLIAAYSHSIERDHLYVDLLGASPQSINDPSSASKGGGTEAIKHLVELSIAAGKKGKIKLDPTDAAASFYQKLGFKKKGYEWVLTPSAAAKLINR